MHAERDKDGKFIIQDLTWLESRLIITALKLFHASARYTDTGKSIEKLIEELEKIN